MLYQRSFSLLFIVGIAVSSYLYSNIDLKIIGGIFFLVSFIQLFDYVFWTTKSKDTNRLFTKLAVIVNNIQPLIFAYLIYREVKGKNLVYLYGIVMVLYMMENWKLLKTTEVGPDGIGLGTTGNMQNTFMSSF